MIEKTPVIFSSQFMVLLISCVNISDHIKNNLISGDHKNINIVQQKNVAFLKISNQINNLFTDRTIK